jgi:hypothetical protein
MRRLRAGNPQVRSYCSRDLRASFSARPYKRTGQRVGKRRSLWALDHARVVQIDLAPYGSASPKDRSRFRCRINLLELIRACSDNGKLSEVIAIRPQGRSEIFVPGPKRASKTLKLREICGQGHVPSRVPVTSADTAVVQSTARTNGYRVQSTALRRPTKASGSLSVQAHVYVSTEGIVISRLTKSSLPRLALRCPLSGAKQT